MAYTLRVVVWMKKHALNKISVVMDMRGFKVVPCTSENKMMKNANDKKKIKRTQYTKKHMQLDDETNQAY